MKHTSLIKHHEQSIPELKTEINKIEKELIEVKMKQQLGQVKNVRAYKNLRHDIARLMSIISIKELAE
jgi:ribosomal protein L29